MGVRQCPIATALLLAALIATIRAAEITTTEESDTGTTPESTEPPPEETAPAGAPDDLNIFLVDENNSTGNVTRNCGRPKPESLTCPDDDIIFYLYSGPNATRERIDITDPKWLNNSRFDSSLPTVMLVHGYRGGDSLMPMVIIKDAYIKEGTHNVIMLDWGILAKASCYPQAVGSLKAVAKCSGQTLKYLQEAGVNIAQITCVGHSLGSHVCGLTANYISDKLERIVALDPARPLIRNRRPPNRLDDKDAKVVQVIHTNAGFYGESGRQGTVDFCVNSGRIQPFCEKAKNEQLCSHIEAVCFYAESMNVNKARLGEPCSVRCPIRNPDRVSQRTGEPARMGAYLDSSTAEGMYCVKAPEAPYCRNPDSDDPEYGDSRCCLRHVQERYANKIKS